ncbi:MAG: CPBP family intramembrane metalloprotease [Erysipelotrichaceae bacterium]|nr:CPBP family intramembrane metalloprotease [Erysipelotrichaceae bacterium]
MNTQNNQNTHILLNHPILSAILLDFLYILIYAGIALCFRLFGTGSDVPEAASFLIAVLPAFGLALTVKLALKNGFILGLRRKKFGECVKLGWPILTFLVLEIVLNSLDHPWYAAVTFAGLTSAFFYAASYGFSEELLFRSVMTNNMMRVWMNKKHGIYAAAVISSLLFGAVHLFNAVSSGFTPALICQLAYAAAMGVLFGAMFLRTRNLWGCIFIHTLLDFISILFSAGDTASNEAVSKMLSTAVSIEALMFYALLIASSLAAAFYIMRPSKHEQIKSNWMPAQSEVEETASSRAASQFV